MREIKMPSGAILKVEPSPFADAKALYQAILAEARGLSISKDMEMPSLFKDLFCVGFASPEIERCLWACMKRCRYNGTGADLKVDESTFEPINARQDYMSVCVEVAKENVMPFMTSLFAEYQRALAMTEKNPA